MTLTDYRTLGRSGLVVSPLALGTMTFGTARWGSDEETSRAVFTAFTEAGGTFIDTADVYSGGESEAMLGRFMAEAGNRERLVIGTKSGFATGQSLAGGNGARHVHAALNASLRRLQTDFIDLYWVHVWDSVTPAEELLDTMASLVRAGKIRYWGLSNTPAWFAAQVATLAAQQGKPGPVALQYFYSLANRDVEDEHLPLAQATGMALVPWSPLAFGLLAGKYDRATVEQAAPRESGLPRDAAGADARRSPDDKRLDGSNPFGDSLFTTRNWAIVNTLREVAAEMEQSPAAVALAWVTGRPGVGATLIGVSRTEQLHANIASLTLTLSPDHRERLDRISAPDPRMLYSLFTPAMRHHAVFGAPVTGWTGA